MTWGVLIALAGVFAFLVASSILTVGATVFVATVAGVIFKPAERKLDAKSPNVVYEIEVEGSQDLRDRVVAFPKTVRMAGVCAAVLFFLPTLLAIFGSEMNGIEIDAKSLNVGWITGWVNDFSFAAFAAMIAYPLFVLYKLFSVKVRLVSVLEAHAKLKARIGLVS